MSANDTAARFEIVAIQTRGNSRTHESVIERAAAIRPGIVLSERDLDAVKQRVMNLRIFSKVDVIREQTPTGDILVIDVNERWTTIPLPFLSGSGDGYTVGGVLIEANFLGLNKQIGIGGSYSTQGSSIFALYRDPAVLGTRALAQTTAYFFDGPRKRYSGNDLVDAFSDRTVSLSVLGGYRFTENLSALTGALINGGSTEAYGDFMPPPDRGLLIGPQFKVIYDQQNYQLILNQGFRAESRLVQGLSVLGSSRNVLMFDINTNYGVLLPWHHSLSLSLGLHVRRGNPYLDTRTLGGNTGTRGFRDEGLWAENGALSTVEYAVPFARIFGGTWTAAAFADAGLTEWNGEREAFVTPGAGLRFFLENIAIPAIGVDVSYSTDQNEFLVSGNIGISR